ncbi:MAG TPA: hypothetical protein VFU11_08715 [Solirubrobacterales bacterium]|nr:hypothetical protein [Solirubrobacterales bacterium]
MIVWLERNALIGLVLGELLMLTIFVAFSILVGPVSVAGGILLGSSVGYLTVRWWIRTKPPTSHRLWMTSSPVVAELEQVRDRVEKRADGLASSVSEDVIAARMATAKHFLADAELYAKRGLERKTLGQGFVVQCERIVMSIVDGRAA